MSRTAPAQRNGIGSATSIPERKSAARQAAAYTKAKSEK